MDAKRYLLLSTLLFLLGLAACQDDPDPQPLPDLIVTEAFTVTPLEPTPVATAGPIEEPENESMWPEPTRAEVIIPISDGPEESNELCDSPANWFGYDVVFGDTLAEIARRTSSTVAELSAANCIENPNRIRVGLRLLVPRVPDPLPTPPPVTPAPEDVTTIYDEAVCYGSPFQVGHGVALGERWQLDYGIDTLPVFANPSDRQAGGMIFASEPFTVIAGPHCFHRPAYSNHFLRRWFVESEVSSISGWIEEYHDYLQWRPAPELVSFSLSASQIAEGESVTISWELRGINEVMLWQQNPISQYGLEMVAGPLPPAGSLTITPPRGVPFIEYTLGDTNATRRLQVECTHAPFLLTTGQGCPAAAVATLGAAYQPFERGFMVWKPGVIWVMYADGYGAPFHDGFVGAELPFTENPPAGLFVPERGFGKVWQENLYVRERLGWATAPEQGFEMDFQSLQISPWDEQALISLPSGHFLVINIYHSSLSWHFSSRP